MRRDEMALRLGASRREIILTRRAHFASRQTTVEDFANTSKAEACEGSRDVSDDQTSSRSEEGVTSRDSTPSNRSHPFRFCYARILLN